MRFIQYSLLLCVFLLTLPGRCEQREPAQSADADFQARCHAPGVIRCYGFDSEAEVRPHLEAAWDGVYRAEVVKDIKASGAGSLRFTIPPHSPADTSGSFWLDFSDDLRMQFGAGEEFYVQWRQRFSPEMLTTEYKGGNGWKQAIVGEGSRPGHTAYSCTEIHLVVEDTYQVGAPRMYHSCGKKDGRYEPLEIAAPHGMLIQNAVGCLHNDVKSPPCMTYKANQWMTFQLHVKVGTWYKNDKNYHHDSTIQLWVGYEGKKSVLAIDMDPKRGTGYDLVNLHPEAKYGKIWFLPYDTDKDITQNHPTAYTWYDELIISRNRIADPR
jgi:hypothetical protein